MTLIAPPRLSILVIDDNADTAASLAELLTIYGYDARCLGGDVVGWREPLPDVLIVDSMRGIAKWGLADRLAGAAKRPIVIAISGYESGEDFRECLTGIDLHLVKPVDPDVLLGALRRFAKRLNNRVDIRGRDRAKGSIRSKVVEV